MMAPMKSKELPINCAARNAVWVYDDLVPPRFDGAPAIVERRRSHERPDFHQLPAEADIAVELYGGAITLRLDGERRRIYTTRFEFAQFGTDEETRYALLTLWRKVEALDSVAAAKQTAAEWLDRTQLGS
jgi:hypothetical protein